MEASRLTITKKLPNFTALILILLVLNILGAFLYGIGLIFTIPYTYASIYVAFNSVFPEISSEAAHEVDDDKLDFTMFR